MYDRLASLLLSYIFLRNAHSVFTTGSSYVVYGHYYSFGEIKNIVGVVFGLFGLLLLVYGILGNVFGKNNLQKNELPEFTICPNCNETFGSNDLEDLKCKKCGHGLENIKGYYERHPDKT